MGADSQIQMLATLSHKGNSPLPNEQAVGGSLRRSARCEIIIIIYENFNFFKIHFNNFIRYKLNTRLMSAIYATTEAEFQMTGVTQNIPNQLNASRQYFLQISCHQSS
jgi:hypothetical protein